MGSITSLLRAWRDRAIAPGTVLFRRRRRPSVAVADPRYDDWAVVADFEQVETARAFGQQLEELGLDVVLTADWPPDRFGRGDIALRVPADQYGDATVLLDGLE